MPNPMTGAGYDKPNPTPRPIKPNPKAPKADSKKTTKPPAKRKMIRLGAVTTYEGSLYEKRQRAFLKKMQEMNKRNAPKG